MRRLAGLLAAIGATVTAGACGSSHRAQLATEDQRVRIAAYSSHGYSVQQVKRAFAALGLELHRGATPAPGVVSLLNDTRLGPQHIPSPPRVVMVVVATQRHAGESTELQRGRNTQVLQYANVTAFSKPGFVAEVRSAMSALRWGTAAKPAKGLIVPGSSIDGIQLYESRASIEKALGAGHTIRRGLVSYFGGHLVLNYWFHDGLYEQVEYLETRWSGYRTRSGVHVGSSQRELRPLYVTCTKADCVLLAGPHPDPVATDFAMRHGKVVGITIGAFG